MRCHECALIGEANCPEHGLPTTFGTLPDFPEAWPALTERDLEGFSAAEWQGIADESAALVPCPPSRVPATVSPDAVNKAIDASLAATSARNLAMIPPATYAKLRRMGG